MATILSNSEIVSAIGLPSDIVTQLQTAQGDTFSAVANQFLSALVNKIVYQKVESMDFTNPFKRFDSYPVNYGDTIENIFVDRTLGYKYDRTATDPFGISKPTVKTTYPSINYEMQYKTTIYDSDLRRAALNQYGFMNIINTILKSLVTGRSVDEYLATIIMLNNSDIYAKGFEEVDVSSETTDSGRYEKVTHTLVDVAKDMELPSIDNNKMNVLNVTNASSLLLVIKQSVLNSINLDFLTGVFNLDKVDLVKNIIPVRSFMCVVNTANGNDLTPSAKGDDIDFVLLDSRGFDNHVALQDGGMIYNPQGKYTNHFDNLWKILSYNWSYQARAFKIKTQAS